MLVAATAGLHKAISGQNFSVGEREKAAAVTAVVIAALAIVVGGAMLFQAHGLLPQLPLFGTLSPKLAFLVGTIPVGVSGVDLAMLAVLEARSPKKAIPAPALVVKKEPAPVPASVPETPADAGDAAGERSTTPPLSPPLIQDAGGDGSTSEEDERDATSVPDTTDSRGNQTADSMGDSFSDWVSLNVSTTAAAAPLPPTPPPKHQAIQHPHVPTPPRPAAPGTAMAAICAPLPFSAASLAAQAHALRSTADAAPRMPGACLADLQVNLGNKARHQQNQKVFDAEAALKAWKDSDDTMVAHLKDKPGCFRNCPSGLRNYLIDLDKWAQDATCQNPREKAFDAYWTEREGVLPRNGIAAGTQRFETGKKRMFEQTSAAEASRAQQRDRRVREAIYTQINFIRYTLPDHISEKITYAANMHFIQDVLVSADLKPRKDHQLRTIDVFIQQLQTVIAERELLESLDDRGFEQFIDNCNEAWDMIAELIRRGLSPEVLGLYNVDAPRPMRT